MKGCKNVLHVVITIFCLSILFLVILFLWLFLYPIHRQNLNDFIFGK